MSDETQSDEALAAWNRYPGSGDPHSEKSAYLSGFRAGAASHPTAADVAELLVEADTYPWNELSVVQDLVAALRAQANLNLPALVQVVPETLELDPEPMATRDDQFPHAYFASDCIELGCKFNPLPRFSHDRAAYGLPDEGEEQR